jgi:hypothetical protein
MLSESIIRLGRPIVKSDLSFQERIRLLTDVSSTSCKNYFQNVVVVELGNEKDVVHCISVGGLVSEKEGFIVDQNRNTSFPVVYPNGGNPLHAQGVYPLPCYLMWEPHIKAMGNMEEFHEKVLLPRIKNTIGYRELKPEEKEKISQRVAKIIADNAERIIKDGRQLGILMVFDPILPVFTENDNKQERPSLWIAASILNPKKNLCLDGTEFLKRFVRSKMDEAATLGRQKKGVSTFSNKKHDEVVSIYNKSWLWLSPTWEMPCSIYWGDKEWTKGMKIDGESYEAFLYGSQFLKEIQVPITGSILKEMFAPITSYEAKKHMKATSFQAVFGIPMVLPLLDGDSRQEFKKYKRMLKNEKDLNQGDLHMEVLAGLKDKIVPQFSDNHRLTILYYSGDLSRGDMHIRAVIEDVIPSMASKIQDILRKLQSSGLGRIQELFDAERKSMYKTENLPSMLANAFGPGYVWDALQKVFHGFELRTERMYRSVAYKLNELAKREEYWEMKQELVFKCCFEYFVHNYNASIRGIREGVNKVFQWKKIIERYHLGEIEETDLLNAETLGFVSGMLLKQFSNSYYQKTKKDFMKHRVMKFGSKLSPEMIWKQGVLRCQELSEQWDMGLAGNFWTVLPKVLLGFLEANKMDELNSHRDEFMTAFWSGYLIFRQTKNQDNQENNQEVRENEN